MTLARHWLSRLLLCAFSLVAARASADGAAVATGAAVSANSGRQKAHAPRAPTELLGRELPEWVDPLTGSASRLASSCELTLEARLSGMPKRNYLNLTVANNSGLLVLIDLQNVEVRFGSGLTRRLTQESQFADVTIRPDWSTHYTFAFPSKADFEHEDRLSVEMPLSFASGETCTATVSLAHRPGAKVPERSYTSYSPLEMAMGMNVHFAATGDLRTIAENVNPGFDIGWTLYPWVRHGFTFEFGVDAYGRRGLSAVAPDREAGAIGAGFAMLGYSYRWLPLRWLTFEYNLNAGVYGLSTTTPDGKDRVASSSSLGIREKLKLNFRVFENDGGRVEIGPALIHSYIPTGDFGATTASGNLFSGALYVTVD